MRKKINANKSVDRTQLDKADRECAGNDKVYRENFPNGVFRLMYQDQQLAKMNNFLLTGVYVSINSLDNGKVMVCELERKVDCFEIKESVLFTESLSLLSVDEIIRPFIKDSYHSYTCSLSYECGLKNIR